MSNFIDFNLHEKCLQVLTERNFTTPTTIQMLAIPEILRGRDLIASAQTGTGKTAAFVLPILHQLTTQSLQGKGPFVIILVPTRELALQVSEEVKRFSKYLPQLKSACIYGGVPYFAQKKALSTRCDIIIATPGRLLDHMQQRLLDLTQVKFLVLDEADRMLDMGFLPSIEKIVLSSPKNRQTLLFSATIDKRILPISKRFLQDPIEIKAPATHVEKTAIESFLYYSDNIAHKMQLLENLLENTHIYQAIIFTATKRHADELSRNLKKKGYDAQALHGDMNQRQRTFTIDKMRKGKVHLLIATDVAARGIDIIAITHVINFDLPRNPEDFIHRIGRTGRAGATGMAISFAARQEEQVVQKINRLLENPMKVQTIVGLEPKASSKSFRDPHSHGQRSQRQPQRSSGQYSKSHRHSRGFQEHAPRFQQNSSRFQEESHRSQRDFSKEQERGENNFEQSRDFSHKKPFKKSFKKPHSSRFQDQESSSRFQHHSFRSPEESLRSQRDFSKEQERGESNFEQPRDFSHKKPFKKSFKKPYSSRFQDQENSPRFQQHSPRSQEQSQRFQERSENDFEQSRGFSHKKSFKKAFKNPFFVKDKKNFRKRKSNRY